MTFNMSLLRACKSKTALRDSLIIMDTSVPEPSEFSVQGFQIEVCYNRFLTPLVREFCLVATPTDVIKAL